MTRRLGLLAVLGAGITVACAPARETHDPPKTPPSSVAVAPTAPSPATATPHNTDGPLLLAGDLRPSAAVELGFKAGGQLAQRKVERGERVRAGQVLATLSDDEARAQLAQAEAAVAGAKAQADLAADAAGRVETLRGADAAPGNLAVSTKLQVEAARAGVRQAEAVLALARANLNNHVLRAPFDGVVVRVPEGVGGMVGPGIPVFRLEKLDPLLLQATVGEHEAASIKVGDTVRFANGGREYEGTVKTVVGSLEAVTRRVPVEVEVRNADGLLLAGSYIRARLVGATASR
jgi:RND family efflux transporter MFP subunit